jgi:hypothetical protein
MSIRSTFARFSAAAMLVLVGAHTSFAQRIEPMAASSRFLSTDVTSRQPVQGETTKGPFLTWGGVIGGAVGGSAGLFGGLLAGAMLAHTGTCAGEDCSLGAALVGAGVGEVLGLATGAHIGSAGRGNLALAILASTAIGAAGIYAAGQAGGSAPGVVLAIPVMQLAAVLVIER